MSCSIHGRFREQVRFLRRQFLQDDELPFTDVLSESAVAQALKALDVVWLDRIYSPLVTLMQLLQVELENSTGCTTSDTDSTLGQCAPRFAPRGKKSGRKKTLRRKNWFARTNLREA
jgi:hypothetical protein